jgi:hypothetical protein
MTLDIATKYCALVHSMTTGRLKPNAGPELLLEAVSSRLMLAAARLANDRRNLFDQASRP